MGSPILIEAFLSTNDISPLSYFSCKESSKDINNIEEKLNNIPQRILLYPHISRF